MTRISMLAPRQHRGGRFVGWLCLFIAGALFGVWLAPEPRFAACVEIPKKTVQKLPTTKAGKAAFVAYYKSRGTL